MNTQSKSTPKITPLRYTLTFSFLSVIVMILITITVQDLFEFKRELKQNFLLLMEQSEQNIINAIQLVDTGYQGLETALDDRMRQAFVPFIQAYEEAKGDPSKMDLEGIREKLGKGFDLYLVNKQGVVEYTTYAKDLGLDFKQFPNFYKNLMRILKGDQYEGDRISTESQTGKLRKFAYMPTPDNQYLLELGLKSDEFKKVLERLDMVQISKKLKGFNPYLEHVRLFDHKGTLFGSPDYKTDDERKQIIKTVYESGHPQEIEVEHTLTRYIYADLRFDNVASDTSRIVELIYNIQPIEERFQEKMIGYGIFIIIAIVLSTFITLWISTWITKPIRKIIEDIDTISKGNLDHPIEVETNNELSILKQSAQVMVQNIKGQLNYISKLNEAHSRFVPHEFLKHLGKTNITEVMLGNSVERSMSVLFTDIRAFTTLSETMTPEENFMFLNDYLRKMVPLIKDNHGFIDKYIGDAIMALFDQKADDAVRTGIAMLQQLRDFNEFQRQKNRPPVQMGVGIHTGQLMLGTIGEENRMETTVISDAVNVAARLESMTKLYGVSMLISDAVHNSLERPNDFKARVVDKVQAKGKKSAITIFEVFNGDDVESIEKKTATRKPFQEGVALYYLKDFQGALHLFENCLERFPEDKATQIYIKRCQHYLKFGWDDHWDGVTLLEQK